MCLTVFAFLVLPKGNLYFSLKNFKFSTAITSKVSQNASHICPEHGYVLPYMGIHIDDWKQQPLSLLSYYASISHACAVSSRSKSLANVGRWMQEHLPIVIYALNFVTSQSTFEYFAFVSAKVDTIGNTFQTSHDIFNHLRCGMGKWAGNVKFAQLKCGLHFESASKAWAQIRKSN